MILALLMLLVSVVYVLFFWDDPAIRRLNEAKRELEETPAPRREE